LPEVGFDRLDEDCPHDAATDKLADRVAGGSVAGANLQECAPDPAAELICQRQLHAAERCWRASAAELTPGIAKELLQIQHGSKMFGGRSSIFAIGRPLARGR